MRYSLSNLRTLLHDHLMVVFFLNHSQQVDGVHLTLACVQIQNV